MNTDTVEKIVKYLAAVAKTDITYKETTYRRRDKISVTMDIFRGYTCPSHCGGCCHRFSLDYLPNEAKKLSHPVRERGVIINNRESVIYSDMQLTGTDECHYLNTTDGRCGIHQQRPFSCDFELIRVILQEKKTNDIEVITSSRINVQKFTRGWRMRRIDGERGALCEMLPATKEIIDDTVRKLKLLRDWAIHFKVETHMDTIIEWAESNPTENLVITQ